MNRGAGVSPAGTYGCSGVCWVLEANPLPEAFHQGQIIRLFKEGWPVTDTVEE